MTTKSDALRKQAHDFDRQARESFERCDTDGFLSQWASGLSADRLRLEAEIQDNDGMAEFGCLVDEDGKILPARVIETRYGGCYALFADFDEANGNYGEIVEWLSETKIKRYGYRRALALRKARAEIVGSNAVNCRAAAVPADDLQVNAEAEVVYIFED